MGSMSETIQHDAIIKDASERIARVFRHFGRRPTRLILPEPMRESLIPMALELAKLYSVPQLGPGESTTDAIIRAALRGRLGVEVDFARWLDEPFAVPPTWSVP